MNPPIANPRPQSPGELPDGPLVLITGASTGVGLALARRLLAARTDGRRYRLVLTARESSLERIEALRDDDSAVFLRPLDVTDDTQRRAVIADCRDWGGVDVLVNNAGVAYRSVVEHVQDDERLAQMSVNFQGPMELARLVLPEMRAKRTGRIINVSSVGGMMAMPTMAAYSASKFALEGATESLWYEVRPWNVAVTLIEPGFLRSDGFTHTVFTRRSQRSMDRLDAAYHQHYEHMSAFVEKLMRRAFATPDSVARKIHRVIEARRPPLRVQATLDAHFFSLLRRILPRGLYHELLYRMLPGISTWGPKPAGSEPMDPEPKEAKPD